MADVTVYSVKGRHASESLGIMTGAGGSDFVEAATVNAHTYVSITALDACTVSATSIDTDVWDSLTTIEVPAGCTIYGLWSEVTIGTGDAAIVHRRESTT